MLRSHCPCYTQFRKALSGPRDHISISGLSTLVAVFQFCFIPKESVLSSLRLHHNRKDCQVGVTGMFASKVPKTEGDLERN